MRGAVTYQQLVEFHARVEKAAAVFELAGWTPQQAEKRAMDAEFTALQLADPELVETLFKALDAAEGDY